MTSLAPPSFQQNLKKRSRMMSPEATYDVGGYKKRPRTNETSDDTAFGNSDADIPKYTQRHVDYFEQVKQADLNRLRAEFEQHLMKKDGELQQYRSEVNRLQEHTSNVEKGAERLNQENKVLKRAINIQKQQKEEKEQENSKLKQLATQAAEHIRRLEQSNYALQVHLQTTNRAGTDYSNAPDVY